MTEAQDPIIAYALVNTTPGHYKFWNVYCPRRAFTNAGTKYYYVSVHYGRIGTTGHRSSKHFVTHTSAVQYIQRTVHSKLRRGYDHMISHTSQRTPSVTPAAEAHPVNTPAAARPRRRIITE